MKRLHYFQFLSFWQIELILKNYLFQIELLYDVLPNFILELLTHLKAVTN